MDFGAFVKSKLEDFKNSLSQPVTPVTNFSSPLPAVSNLVQNTPIGQFLQQTDVGKFGQTLGNAAAAPMVGQALQQGLTSTENQQNQLLQQIRRTQDPAQKQRLVKLSQNLAQSQANQANQAINTYNKTPYDIAREGLGTFGTIFKPSQAVLGGALNAGLQAGSNVINGQPIGQNLSRNLATGANFGAELAPLSAAVGVGLDKTPVGQLLPKLSNFTPALQAIRQAPPELQGQLYQALAKQVGLDLARNAVTGGVSSAALGALQPAKDINERLGNTVKLGAQGAAFQAGTRALGFGLSALKSNPPPVGLSTTDVSKGITPQKLYETPEVQQAETAFRQGNSPAIVKAYDSQLTKAQASGDYRGALSILQPFMAPDTRQAVNNYLTEVADVAKPGETGGNLLKQALNYADNIQPGLTTKDVNTGVAKDVEDAEAGNLITKAEGQAILDSSQKNPTAEELFANNLTSAKANGTSGGLSADDPQYVAKQASLARFGAMQPIEVQAKLVAQNAQSTLKGGDNYLFRYAIENPKEADSIAGLSSDPEKFSSLLDQYQNFTDKVAESLKNTNPANRMNYIDDYFTHIWDLSTPEDRQNYDDFMAANAKNFSSGFTKQRFLGSIQDGLDAGLRLKNENVSQDVIQYANSMNTQIGAAAFNQKLNELRPGGALPDSQGGAGTRNYQGKPFLQSNVPGNQGTFIDPEVQQYLGGYNRSAFADNPIIAGKDVQIGDNTYHIPGIDQANQLLKEVKLALGGFHGLNTTMRMAVNDPTSIPQAVRNTFDSDANAKFMQDAVDDGVIDYGARVGVTFDTSGDVLPQNATFLDTVGSKNPIQQFNNRLFGGLINTYKVNLTESLMQKFPDAATDPVQAEQAQAYGAQINDLMGGLNYEVLGRNKTLQQGLRLVGLAPDFNEGMLRQASQAVNPNNYVSDTQRPAAIFALKNIVGQVALWASIAEAGKLVSTGHFSPDFKSFVDNSILKPSIPLPNSPIFNSPKSGNPQQASLPSSELQVFAGAVNDPSHFLQARGSALLSSAGALASGQDYFGNPLVNPWNGTPDTLPNRLKALVPANLPIPAVQFLKTQAGTQTPAVGVLNTLGLRIGANQQTPKYQATKAYFDGIDQAASTLNPNDQQLFLGQIHPTTKDPDGNPVIDKNQYTKPAQFETFLANPKVFAAEKNFQLSQPSHDPFWDWTPDQERAYMQAQVISKNDPGGDKATTNALYSAIPQQAFDARTQYFDNLVATGQIQPSTGPQAPKMPKEISDFWNYEKSLPYGTGARTQALQTPVGQQALAFLQQSNDFTNAQRVDMGLPLLAGSSSSGGYSSSRRIPFSLKSQFTKSKNIKAKKIQIKVPKTKFKTFKSKKAKVANPKLTKLKI